MSIVAGYEVGERLSVGLRSVVHRARRRVDGAAVVLKLLQEGRAGHHERAQLAREFEVMRAVSDDGVVRAVGLERYGDDVALVVEDFGGSSLRALAAREKLTVAAVLEVGSKVAAALGAVHREGIIHKDVNPSNVVLNPETGVLKLIDFGIATTLTRESLAPRSVDRLEGTLAYISPEQTGRMNRSVDRRSDLYSLGATLYELLVGEPPFRGDDAVEVVHGHIALEPVAPHLRDPSVPVAVSRVVLKLLAKAAEDRYQSAWGLKADLDACARALRAGTALPDEEPGRTDVPDRFVIPQRLYGRERELAALMGTFARVAEGAAELLLVSGYAGIGKSALVNEVHRPITRARGYFAAGKFDQYHRDVPYSALLQCLGDLMRQLLAERESSLAAWRARLQEALGENGAVIADLLPDVALIAGPQPPVEALSPAESLNRWNLVFLRFLRCLAAADRPLVLFLDDLQWADSSSLKLLQHVVTDGETRHLLIIGAYRDNEVSAAHPLALTLDALRRAGASPTMLALGPLAQEHVEALVVDALRVSPEDARDLAGLAREKTLGNPFFLGQFLSEAADAGLLRFDAPAHRWTWDLDEIRARGITDNVVELMAGKIERLPEDTRRVLRIAACVGGEFSLRILAGAAKLPLADAAATLWVAVREGLLVPLGDDARRAEPPGAEGVGTFDPSVGYRFLHDRVQQAAYSRLSAEDREAVHLRLARLLREDLDDGVTADRLFDAANQYAQCARRITDPAEALAVADTCLAAALKAKAASAWEGAQRYLEVAIGLLPADAFDAHHAFAMELHIEAVEAALAVPDLARAEVLATIALERARTPLDKARIYEKRALNHTARGDVAACVDAGITALALLGVELPTPKDAAEGFAAVIALEALLAGRGPEELASLPRLTDPVGDAQLRLLMTITAPVYIVRPALFMPVVCEMVRLSVLHGNGPVAPFGYVEYALIRTAIGDAPGGERWVQLALGLQARSGARSVRAKVQVVAYAFVTHWSRHLRESVDPMLESIQLGLDVGDFEFAGYAADLYGAALLYTGDALETVTRELARYTDLLTRIKQAFARLFACILLQAARNLAEPVLDPLRLHGEAFDESRELAPLVEAKVSNLLCLFHTSRATLAYVFGDPAEAAAQAELAEPHLPAMTAHFTSAQHGFYSALAHAALADGAEGEAREALVAKAAAKRALLAAWAATAPMNMAHKLALVDAELARVAGRTLDAMDLYEDAIRGAAAQRFRHEEALAYERAAGMYRSLGRARIAGAYLHEARARYLAWGAHGKVGHMERAYADLLPSRAIGLSGSGYSPMTVTSTERGGALLDLATVMKASRALSGELVLDKLVQNVMRVAVENAGAQRGLLLLMNDGRLRVAAEQRPGESQVLAGGDAPLEGDRRLSVAVVNFVLRTRQSVVLDDATREGLFTADHYVIDARPRSVLCAPLMHRGAVTGVIYLENNLMAAAFTADRLETLRLLSSQAALAITNARLFADLERSRERLEDANRTLEEKVEARTHELTLKNDELGAALAQLRETQRQLVTQEKLASLGALTAGIAHELKNPLNFINNFAALTVGVADEIAELTSAARGGDLSALDDLPEPLADLKQNASKIQEYGRRADGIINGMLAHSRLGPSAREAADLNALLAESLNLAYHGARASDPSFNTGVRTELDPAVGEVHVARNDLSRVFVNVIHNALYATREKKRRLGAAYAPMIHVRTVSLGDRVEVRVHDNGTGIPAEVREKVFNPFFTTKPPGEGTGLGLSLSHDVVVGGHQGDLRVDSVEGEYTEFVVTLPRAPAEAR